MEKPIETDIYGFQSSKQSNPKNIPTKERSISMKKTNVRIEKWRIFLHKSFDKLLPSMGSKIKKKVRKGVPDCLRGKVWPKLARLDINLKDFPYEYSSLKGKPSESLNEILLDVNRTFPNHPFCKSPLGQESLTSVLTALSLSFKGMGYCQGLNFLAGTFLLYMNDEKVFLVISSILKNYRMLELYTDLTTLKPIFLTFEWLIAKHLPKISIKLKKMGVLPDFYATAWFLTFYILILPFNTVLRIMDIFLLEGFKIIYRIGLAIFKLKEKKLMAASDSDEIIMELKEFQNQRFEDEDLVIKTALKFKCSRKGIKKLEEKALKTLKL